VCDGHTQKPGHDVISRLSRFFAMMIALGFIATMEKLAWYGRSTGYLAPFRVPTLRANGVRQHLYAPTPPSPGSA
jgi:hypothetical protein